MPGPPNGWSAGVGRTHQPGVNIIPPVTFPVIDSPLLAPALASAPIPTSIMYPMGAQPYWMPPGSGCFQPPPQYMMPPPICYPNAGGIIPPPPPPPPTTISTGWGRLQGVRTSSRKVPGRVAPNILSHGSTLLYDAHYATINVITNCFVLEPTPKFPDPQDASIVINNFTAPCSLTGKALMERIGYGEDKWKMVEVIEQGDNTWTVGQTIKFGDDRAKETLEKYGWKDAGSARKPPVWVVMKEIPADT